MKVRCTRCKNMVKLNGLSAQVSCPQCGYSCLLRETVPQIESFREGMGFIAAAYGVEVFANVNLVENMAGDLMPQEKKKRAVLHTAFLSDAISDLLHSTEADVARKKAADKLTTFAVSEAAAEEFVQEMMEAFGLVAADPNHTSVVSVGSVSPTNQKRCRCCGACITDEAQYCSVCGEKTVIESEQEIEIDSKSRSPKCVYCNTPMYSYESECPVCGKRQIAPQHPNPLPHNLWKFGWLPMVLVVGSLVLTGLMAEYDYVPLIFGLMISIIASVLSIVGLRKNKSYQHGGLKALCITDLIVSISYAVCFFSVLTER